MDIDKIPESLSKRINNNKILRLCSTKTYNNTIIHLKKNIILIHGSKYIIKIIEDSIPIINDFHKLQEIIINFSNDQQNNENNKINIQNIINKKWSLLINFDKMTNMNYKKLMELYVKLEADEIIIKNDPLLRD